MLAILQGQNYNHQEVKNHLSQKMEKGVDYPSAGKQNSIGQYSTLEGINNNDTGVGNNIEGINNTATGQYSHIEGQQNQSNNDYQHVFGQYNIPGDYAEIVGSGTSTLRKNIRTLDWNGNEILNGQLTLETEPDQNINIATKSYADNILASKADITTLPIASTVTPNADGEGSTGNSIDYARGDHQHPTDNNLAPIFHAYEGSNYGIGSGTDYGHVKLSDAPNVNQTVDDGIAVTPKALYLVSPLGGGPSKAMPSDIPMASQVTPKQDITAAEILLQIPMGNTSTLTTGTLTAYARADHVHPVDTSRAPKAHATSTTTYGAGNASNYGHVKLSDAVDSTLSTSGGVAATPKAVKTVYDLASGKADTSLVPVAYTTAPKTDGTATTGTVTTYSRSNHVHPVDTTRAPKAHAVTATTYGVGTDTKYGHIKLSNSTSSTSSTDGGLAVSPSAVKTTYDLAAAKANTSAVPTAATTAPLMDGTASAGSGTAYARADHKHPSDTSRAPTNHASTTTTYGVGNASNYGHVKLSDSPSLNNDSAAGYAITPKGAQTVKDNINNSLAGVFKYLTGYNATPINVSIVPGSDSAFQNYDEYDSQFNTSHDYIVITILSGNTGAQIAIPTYYNKYYTAYSSEWSFRLRRGGSWGTWQEDEGWSHIDMEYWEDY